LLFKCNLCRYTTGLSAIDLSEEHFPYDLNLNAVHYEQAATYTQPMMSDAYWLMRNSTWRGDVIFNVKAGNIRTLHTRFSLLFTIRSFYTFVLFLFFLEEEEPPAKVSTCERAQLV
jgi:hypothetical protein